MFCTWKQFLSIFLHIYTAKHFRRLSAFKIRYLYWITKIVTKIIQNHEKSVSLKHLAPSCGPISYYSFSSLYAGHWWITTTNLLKHFFRFSFIDISFTHRPKQALTGGVEQHQELPYLCVGGAVSGCKRASVWDQTSCFQW